MNGMMEVLIAVLNSLWQATILTALVWLALRYLPRIAVSVNAATRYVIWWVVLAVILVLPAMPRIIKAGRPKAQHETASAARRGGSPATEAFVIERTPVVLPLNDKGLTRWPLWILALWATVFFYRLTGIGRSYVYLRGVKRRATAFSHPLPRMTRTMSLLLSNEVSSPMAVGFLTPAVILPSELPAQLGETELECVLSHEAAHLARYDDWTNLAARLLGAALALHPAALWILSRIDREREMACDDWAVARTGAARPYAASLGRMFDLRLAQRNEAANLGLASGIFGVGSRAGERIEMLLRRGRRFSPRASVASIATSAAVLTALAITASLAPRWIAFAQQPAAARFEVASIKPSAPGGGGRFSPQPGGRLTIENAPLRLLIQNAYNVKPFQVSGGPSWIDSDRFDVNAKSEGNPSVPEMIGPMLKALLEDRFQLKVHTETKQLPVFFLVAAKGGMKLTEAKVASCGEKGADTPPAPPRPGSPFVPPCGRVIFGLSPSGAVLEGRTASIASLIFTLSNIMGRTVVDKTGFSGTFDLHLEFAHDEAIAGIGTPGGPPALPSAPADPDKPSIFTAFQEQLGLKLESDKGPVEVVVIDHVEKPTAN